MGANLAEGRGLEPPSVLPYTTLAEWSLTIRVPFRTRTLKIGRREETRTPNGVTHTRLPIGLLTVRLPFCMAGQAGFEPTANGFGVHRSTS